MKKELTQELLKELLHYDPDTGEFTWKERPLDMFKMKRACLMWNTRFSNTKAGTESKGGYSITINYHQFMSRILAWIYVYGYFPEKELCAIDGNEYNDAIKNIRYATRTDIRNKARKNINNKFLMGVDKKSKGCYTARICVNKKQIHLGTFDTQEKAHAAYVEAKRKISPDFCIL